jgi:hypothetical protein
MRQVLASEWTKLRTVSGTAWLVAAAVVSTVLLGGAMTASVDTSLCPSPAGCQEDTTRLALAGVWAGQVAVVVLAVLAVTNEYDTGMIQTTLAATPRRGRVLLAKAAVVTTTVLAAGTAGVVGSLAAGRAILPGNGFTEANGYPPLSPADEPTLRAAGGTVLYLGSSPCSASAWARSSATPPGPSSASWPCSTWSRWSRPSSATRPGRPGSRRPRR